jgi:serine/threonine-protein kinase
MLLVFLSVFFAARTWWYARKEAGLVQEFGQQTKEIGSAMRISYLLPLHDIRQETKLARRNLKQLENRMRKMGSVANGPGHYAVGEGFLALHDYAKARDYLLLAWNKYHYRTAEVAQRLGLTLALLYQEGLENAERIEDKKMREAKRREIEKEFRMPALQYLRMGKTALSDSPDYGEALILFLEKQFDAALRKAEAAAHRFPWLYEASKLIGDIHMAQATRSKDRGDPDSAALLYQKAREAYQDAIEIGSSDPRNYEGLCRLEANQMNLQIYQTDISPRETLKRGVKACSLALQADPDSASTMAQTAELYFWWGEYQTYHGEDSTAALEQAIRAAETSVRLNPRNSFAFSIAGNAHYRIASYQFEHGQEPRGSLDLSIGKYRNAIRLTPSYSSHYQNLGNAYWLKSNYEMQHGMNPMASVDQAVANCEKAVFLNPENAIAYDSLGISYAARGSYEMKLGSNPIHSFQRAIESFRKGIQMNPQDTYAYSNLSLTYHLRAEYERMLGQDPRFFLDLAIETGKKSLEIDSHLLPPLVNMAQSFQRKGLFELQQGRDPTGSLNQARNFLNRLLQIDPTYTSGYLVCAQIELTAGRWSVAQKESAEIFFSKARKSLAQALQKDPENVELYLLSAEISRREMESGWSRSGSKSAAEGLEAVQKILSVNPLNAEALAIRGVLLLHLQDRQEGRASLMRALAMNPNLRHEYEPYLR